MVVVEADQLQVHVIVVFIVHVLEIVAVTGQTVVSSVLLRVHQTAQFVVAFARLADVFSPDDNLTNKEKGENIFLELCRNKLEAIKLDPFH